MDYKFNKVSLEQAPDIAVDLVIQCRKPPHFNAGI